MTDVPNILLVILDSARVHNMGVYGYERNTTPFLEGFVEKSTLYEQARSPGIHSIASHVSMFTGYHIHEHRAKYHESHIDVNKTVWKHLTKEHGYKTGLFTANHIVASTSNLSKSFTTVDKPAQKKSVYSRREKLFEDAYGPRDTKVRLSILGNINESITNDRPIRSLANCVWEATRITEDKLRKNRDHRTVSGEKYIDSFLSWKDAQNGPWAACVNLMDTHSPYVPEDQFNRWATDSELEIQNNKTISTGDLLTGNREWSELESLESLYDGTILQVDQYLEKLVDQLKQAGEYDDTLLIITSDHGDTFGEVSQVNPNVRVAGHNYSIHECLTHVPLIVKYPDQKSGEVVSNVVSLTNIPNTIYSTIDESSVDDKFVNEETVFASTFRILEENKSKFPSVADIDQYIGPWKAVYKDENGNVMKYAIRKNDSVTLSLGTPYDTEKRNIDPRPIVENEYSKLDLVDISEDGTSTELSQELENHLEDLGYIR